MRTLHVSCTQQSKQTGLLLRSARKLLKNRWKKCRIGGLLKKYRLPTRLGSLSMQLTSSPLISTYHIRRRSPQVVGKARRQQSAPRAQLSASLDEALSAKRINKQQIRALCELQQEQAFSALALQQERAFAALALQQQQARSQQQAAADALALHQQKK